MGRNVRRIECADRRVHLHAAGKQFGIVAGSVAGAAARGIEHVFAIVDIGLVGRKRVVGEGVARFGKGGTEQDGGGQRRQRECQWSPAEAGSWRSTLSFCLQTAHESLSLKQ
ncbi:hypothetical protein D9M70_560450 [compost metagenome]